jgi:hypothetical protein
MPTTAAPTPESRSGSITVSADGSAWLWTPEHEPAFLTRDHGASWTAVKGLPVSLRIVSDPVESKLFCALSLADHTLYRSRWRRHLHRRAIRAASNRARTRRLQARRQSRRPGPHLPRTGP